MAAMKILSVFLLLALVFELASMDYAEEDVISEKCLSEVGIDRDTLVKFNETKPVETDNEKIKCYMKCAFQQNGWMTSNGELKEGMYASEKKMEEFKPHVPECLSAKGNNDCETAFLFYKCLADKNEKN